ncbi:hypothetical protein FOXYSP1_17632 [Fusarium oxysporum f. sp. phaseoli]
MPSDPNLQAAQAVKALSLRDTERRYPGSKKLSIARIIKRLEEVNTLDYELVIQPNIGRPRLLSDNEDEAIVCFIIWMQKSGLLASKGEIVDAVNTIRIGRDPDTKSVGKMWYKRFCDDYPELDALILKAKEAARYEYEEAGVEETKQWFKRPNEVITRYRIGASEIWNADQAETYTVIGMGNAAGETTPPWLIFKAFLTLKWANIEGDLEMWFAQSDMAFLNSDITLEWVRDFNRKSWEKSAAVQHHQLDFEVWFRYNEHLKSSSNAAASYDRPPGTEGKAKEDLVWRLLIIDGFSGHGSFAF